MRITLVLYVYYKTNVKILTSNNVIHTHTATKIQLELDKTRRSYAFYTYLFIYNNGYRKD